MPILGNFSYSSSRLILGSPRLATAYVKNIKCLLYKYQLGKFYKAYKLKYSSTWAYKLSVIGSDDWDSSNVLIIHPNCLITDVANIYNVERTRLCLT